MPNPLRLLLAVLLTVPTASASTQARAIWTIGGPDAVGTEMGRIQKVLVLPHLLVVLESDQPFLKVFDHNGRLVQSTGRSGGGPGEFRRPSTISFDARTRELAVVDGTNLRVTVYPVSDTLLRPRLLRIEEVSTRGICVLGLHTFSVAEKATTMLRELVMSEDHLDIVRRFGTARSLHELGKYPAVTNQAGGMLWCDTSQQRLIVGSPVLGEVHVVAPSGEPHRTYSLPDFKGLEIGIDQGNLFSRRPNAGHYDLFVDLVDVDGTVSAVVKRWSTGASGPPRLEGYVLMPIDSLDRALTPLLMAWRPVGRIGRGVLCAQDDPIPVISLFASSVCP